MQDATHNEINILTKSEKEDGSGNMVSHTHTIGN